MMRQIKHPNHKSHSHSSSHRKNPQLSLPKLQIRISSNKNLHNYSRLHFPQKDDSSLIAGIGRKHFKSNYSLGLKQVLNPIYTDQDKLNNSNDNGRDDRLYSPISKINLKQFYSLKPHRVQTEQNSTVPLYPAQATKYKNSTNNNNNNNQIKTVLYDKLKTQGSTGLAKGSCLTLGHHQQDQVHQRIRDRVQKVYSHLQMQQRQYKLMSAYAQRKQIQSSNSNSIDKLPYLSKYQLRYFNPTHMSSNF